MGDSRDGQGRRFSRRAFLAGAAAGGAGVWAAGIMPRWLVIITYSSSLALLVSIWFTTWTTLIFPAWVLLISAYILVMNYRGPNDSRDDESQP